MPLLDTDIRREGREIDDATKHCYRLRLKSTKVKFVGTVCVYVEGREERLGCRFACQSDIRKAVVVTQSGGPHPSVSQNTARDTIHSCNLHLPELPG